MPYQNFNAVSMKKVFHALISIGVYRFSFASTIAKRKKKKQGDLTIFALAPQDAPPGYTHEKGDVTLGPHINICYLPLEHYELSDYFKSLRRYCTFYPQN